MTDLHDQVPNPFRKYFFWNEEVRNADKARTKFIEFGRAILKAYESNKFNLNSDSNHEKTIMSHLMRHDYPSEEHRISDILVFLVAGARLPDYTLLLTHL
jgi:hypothetical protein